MSTHDVIDVFVVVDSAGIVLVDSIPVTTRSGCVSADEEEEEFKVSCPALGGVCLDDTIADVSKGDLGFAVSDAEVPEWLPL